MKDKKIAVTIFIIAAVLLWISANINWGGDKAKWIVLADGKGYYAYLPAIFIYHDLNFGFFEAQEMKPGTDPKLIYDYRVYKNGHATNKCFCGTALMQAPFFLTAHAIMLMTGGLADGYSSIYWIFIQIATWFYFIIGLYFLSKLLRMYEFSGFSIIITLIAVTFGTNSFYYIVREAGMSHIYSFALIASFMYVSKKYFAQNQAKLVILLFGLLGLISLIRPSNGLVILMLPFLAGSWEKFKKGILFLAKKLPYLIAGVLIMTAIIAIQPVIYKISTGSFFVDTYGGEVFNFLTPHVKEFLFSYKKGALLYTPIIAVSLAGLYHFWKRNRFQFFCAMIFILVLFYVLSSWSNWWYGGSFSSRVLIEFLPLFMILLAAAINECKTKAMKGVVLIAIFALIVINQIQTYQYRYGTIHYENMDKQQYWENFLRIDRLL